jgi:ABC-type bacteriocin/lantibiotic exporter with double-glycine peptidase domain
VRQQSFFIYDTIKRNITFEDDSIQNGNLYNSLRVSGLDELVDTFPEKLDKIITENGKNISGGQQQRIAIARAVYKNADLIILDEPFNELDEASERRILAHFVDMTKQGKIVVLVTHNKKSLSSCSKIISLDEQG